MRNTYALGILSMLALTIAVVATPVSDSFACLRCPNPSSVSMGTAASYAILAGSTITNTGSTIINGDLGLSPGTAVTGFPPGTVNGVTHVADSAADQAKTDLTAAYNDAAGRTPTATVSADLGGQTLTPGVYNSASSLGLTGTLTLDGQGDKTAVFIFQAGSTLTTASASRVNLINGVCACNVFWQVGSSATLGTNSLIRGTIMADQSITLTTGAKVDGRVLAMNAAVTMDTNKVNVCTNPTTSPTSITLKSITSVPWGNAVVVSGSLVNKNNGAGIGGETITFTGTGAGSLGTATTASDGTFTASGTSPLTAATGWTVQAQFAGNSLYGAKDSSVKPYTTLPHATTLTLAVSPASVANGGTYKVTATLKDKVTLTPLSGMTVSFTADSPIVIGDMTTDASGKAVQSGLIAPAAGTYGIQAHFGGNSQYKLVNSAIKQLTST